VVYLVKKVWEVIWNVLKVVGFLLIVAVGGWALWKYWLKNLFGSSELPLNLSIESENPQEVDDKKRADTIESRLNRLLQPKP